MSRPHLTPSDKKLGLPPRNDYCVCARHCEAWYKPWQSLARRGTIRCHAERSRSISSLTACYEHRLLSASRRFFVTLRMTFKSIITTRRGTLRCHAERSRTLRLSRVQNKLTCYAEAEQGRGTQASPRWLHAMNIVSCRHRGDSSLHSE